MSRFPKSSIVIVNCLGYTDDDKEIFDEPTKVLTSIEDNDNEDESGSVDLESMDTTFIPVAHNV